MATVVLPLRLDERLTVPFLLDGVSRPTGARNVTS
jgi:hypothetical protein